MFFKNSNVMKIGVLISGCGVYDGAEIQEVVLTMLAIQEIGAHAVCIGLNEPQHHVVNHLTGEEMQDQRNMMVEAARITRGKIIDISEVEPADIDGLVIPGGFGSAKNFTDWAFKGAGSSIHPKVKLMVVNLVNIGKPIAALCVSPVVVAKSLEGSNLRTRVTIGTDKESSPYSISDFVSGLESTGTEVVMKTIREIEIDEANKIITAPCYMMDANIVEVRKNIRKAIEALRDLIE
jgi:enhancing lycopene biosynthesis protein 2